MKDGEVFVDFDEDFRPLTPEEKQWRRDQIEAHRQALSQQSQDAPHTETPHADDESAE